MSNNPAGFYVHRSAIEAHKRFVGPHVTITKLANGELLESFYNCTDANIGTIRYKTAVHHIDLSTSPLLTIIPIEMFESCPMIKTVKIGNNITKISDYAFVSCPELVDFNFTGNITEVGQMSFSRCPKLKFSNLDGITSIGASGFSNNEVTKHLYLPQSITSMGNYAFTACSGIETVEIAATKLDPGQMFFRNCPGLKKVWIRSTCTTIKAQSAQYSPFRDCPSDLEIYAEPASKPSGWSQYFNRTGASGGTTVSVVYGQTTRPF